VSKENSINQLSEKDKKWLLDSFQCILQIELQTLRDELKVDFQTQPKRNANLAYKLSLTYLRSRYDKGKSLWDN
jgi:hypothetical protein